MSNCIMCHAPLPPKRRKFCNDNCTSKYHTYHSCGFKKQKPLNDKLSKKLKQQYGLAPIYGSEQDVQTFYEKTKKEQDAVRNEIDEKRKACDAILFG